MSLVSLVVAPIILFRITKMYLKMPKKRHSKWAPMFSAYRKKAASMNYMIFFFLRRYCVLLVLTVLPLSGYFQIVIMMIASIFIIAIIARDSPFENGRLNSMELTNEIVVLLAAYPLLLFTPIVADE